MGFERIEPQVPCKDVERRVQALRRERINNTARRFPPPNTPPKIHNTPPVLAPNLRDIENGTYRRHQQRIQRRSSESLSPNSRASTAPGAPSTVKEPQSLRGTASKTLEPSRVPFATRPPPPTGPGTISQKTVRETTRPPSSSLSTGRPPFRQRYRIVERRPPQRDSPYAHPSQSKKSGAQRSGLPCTRSIPESDRGQAKGKARSTLSGISSRAQGRTRDPTARHALALYCRAHPGGRAARIVMGGIRQPPDSHGSSASRPSLVQPPL